MLNYDKILLIGVDIIMENKKFNFSSFFKKNNLKMYSFNISTIKELSIYYMIVLVIFSIMGAIIFKDFPIKLNMLLLTYLTMFIIMAILYFVTRKLSDIDLDNSKIPKYLTYLSLFLIMGFIIIISVFVARTIIRPSFFLLFNTIVPSLYVLRKREIILTEVLAAVILVILSYFYRNSALRGDIYIAIASLAVGIPYNMVVYRIRMHDLHAKKVYYEQANLDTLTGLPNRRAFNAMLEKVYYNYSYDNLLMAVIDVDNFKEVNDKMGHIYGDETIRMIGDKLNVYAKVYQLFISRTGGDEFVLIGLNIQKVKLNKTLNSLVSNINEVKLDNDLKLSSSIGAFYTVKPLNYTLEDLFNKADEALYFVKNNGKDNIKLVIDEE